MHQPTDLHNLHNQWVWSLNQATLLALVVNFGAYINCMRYVVLPQASRIAVGPTTGLLVQLIKATCRGLQRQPGQRCFGERFQDLVRLFRLKRLMGVSVGHLCPIFQTGGA